MILVELVPHSLPEISIQSAQIFSDFPFVGGINIPDVLRLPVRSYDAVMPLVRGGHYAIPHIRCIDHPLHQPVELIERYWKSGLKQVLVISGDKPKAISTPVFDVTPVQLVSALKRACPDLTVYCGLDPYRSSLKEEIAYCHQKLEAGADGFFTQPFFDVNYAEVFLSQLASTNIFLGASPVTSERSLNYWTTVNNVVFPPNFELSLELNCVLARNMINLAERMEQNIYLMPIKVDAMAYLDGIFGRKNIN